MTVAVEQLLFFLVFNTIGIVVMRRIFKEKVISPETLALILFGVCISMANELWGIFSINM